VSRTASAELLRACRAEDWTRLEQLRPTLLDACRRSAGSGVAMRVGRLLRRMPAGISEMMASRGLGVALIGPDGAGKSTLAAGLEATFPLPVRQVYMGLTGGMLRYVDRLRVPGVVRLGRLLVIWSRYARARYHMVRGRLVVYDRYLYDAEVPTPHSLTRLARLGRWMDGRACPPPDVVVLLDAPGAVMHERKGEYDPQMLEHWRRSFLALRRRVPGLVVVDATQGIDEVRAEVTDRVWQRYRDRWGAG
jgi:thymidylate kinase